MPSTQGEPFLAFEPYTNCDSISDKSTCDTLVGCTWFDWWGGVRTPAVYVCRSRYLCRDLHQSDCGKISYCDWDQSSQECYFELGCISFRGNEAGCNNYRAECFYFAGECSSNQYCAWLGCENGIKNSISQSNSACCSCEDNWYGNACSYCPDTYHTDCQTCLTSNPNCTECTISQNCNSHATSVSQGTVLSPGCDCVCANNWNLPDCSTCPPQYNETNNCQGCSNGYITTLQSCDEQCNIITHCNGNANVVSTNNVHTQCVCECKTGFTGSNCSQCDEANGYILDNASCRKCNNTLDCNGNAASTIVASGGVCLCGVCSDYWEGSQCDNCPVQYDQGTCADCDNFRYAKIANKCEFCTVEDHCYNRSRLAFPNSTGDGCFCAGCTVPYSGPACNSCSQIKFSADCLSCRPGYINYPVCSLCSISLHCSNKAVTVTSVPPSDVCFCDCDGQWLSPDCTNCPNIYNQTTCDKCKSGINGTYGYPTCNQCTIQTNCNNRATEVSSVNDNCVCKCTAHWTGDNCDVCPSRFESTKCNSCAPGRADFPNCVMCNIAMCGSATAVHINRATDKCECECSGSWGGRLCDTCPSKYDQTTGTCSTCADSTRTYPSCGDCTVEVDCNNQALTVRKNSNGTCECQCDNYWTGVKCQSCPEPYTGVTCNYCDSTSVFNSLTQQCRTCDIQTDCSGHSLTVSSTGGLATVCSCDCVNNWTGSDCSQCPEIYSQAECATCAPGRFNYPTCTSCKHYCGKHSESFSVENNTCKCTCKDQWEGEQCSSCPSQYNQNRCDNCVDVSLNYPSCGSSTCDSLKCSVHTSRTIVKDGVCECVCENAWSGETCEICKEGFNVVNDCNSCVAGYAGFPTCKVCSMSDLQCHLEGTLATQISSNKCSCKCNDGVNGEKCNKCKYDVTGTSFPNCEPNPCNCQVDSDIPKWGRLANDGNCSCSAAYIEPTITAVLDAIAPQYYIIDKHPAVTILTSTLSGLSILTFSPTMVMTAARLHGATDVCRVAYGSSSRSISPININLGPDADSVNLGILLGAFSVILLLYLLHVLILLIRVHYNEDIPLPSPLHDLPIGECSFNTETPSFGKSTSFLQRPLVSSMCAKTRFPNVTVFIMIYVFQGVCTACMKLMIAGKSPSAKALGVLSGVMFVIGFIFISLMKVRRNVPRSRFVKLSGSRAVQYLFGPGEWVSVSRYDSIAKWGVLFESYRPRLCWYLVVELVISFVLGTISAIENVSISVCKDLAAALAVVFIVLAVIVLYSGVYLSKFDIHGTAFISVMSSCSLGILAYGYSGDNVSDFHLKAADTILIVTACIAILKCLVDIALLVYVERSRRKVAQGRHIRFIEKGGRTSDMASDDIAWNDDYEMMLDALNKDGISNPHDAMSFAEEEHSPSPLTNPACPSEDSLKLSVSTINDLLPEASSSILGSSAIAPAITSILPFRIPLLDIDGLKTPLSNESGQLSYRSLKAYNVSSQSPLAPLSQRMLETATDEDILL